VAPETQVFTARLTGRPLLDSNGRAIGRVRDVVIWPVAGSEPPRALGLVVSLRRRSIFVPFGRIREVSAEGAQLAGGTVDLDPFSQRAGEMLASSLYGRRTPAGTVADVAITHQERARDRWVVTALAVTRGSRAIGVLGGHGPHIVPWEECRDLFEPGPLAEQLTSLREMAPADLASAYEALPQARRSQLAAALDDEELADLLEEMPEQDQIRLLNSLGSIERSADVVEEMEPDDAADLLGEMAPEQRERLLTAMQAVQAEELRRLLRYDKSTAGGLMTSQPLVFPPDTAVAEVLARVRDPDLPATTAAQVYVCEPPALTPTGRYLGSVGFQRLLRRAPSIPVGECIEARVYVTPELGKNELSARLAAYNLIGVAVCDQAGRLVGAVTVDDVLDHLLPVGWRRTGGDA
jgi:CBS domain-containing protein/sporulation protein YlmC with PRC-barrel domain